MATRVTGKDLSMTIDGVEYNVDLMTVSLESEELDSGSPTFAEHAAGGGRQWYLRGTAVFNASASTFWTAVWENAGSVVPFVFKPQGGLTASASTPVFEGNVDLGPKPNIAMTAGEAAEFEFEMLVSGEPTRDIGEG